MATATSIIDANLSTLQTSFTSGELDPLMRMRVDVQSYFQGMKTGRNIALQAQGGFRRRPGTIYRAALENPSVLHEFSFGQGQSYLFAFSSTKCTIYDDDGVLVTILTSAPWTDSELNDLTLTSSGDTTLVCHKDFWPQRILRTSATTFTLTNFAFEEHSAGFPRYQPYYKFADDAVTMTPAATTGATTLTCSTAHFKADHVGMIFRYSTSAADYKEMIVTAHTELTTNGTFASDASWTKGTGWTIGSGTASCDGSQVGDSDLEQANAAANTKNYQVLFTLSGVTAGSISVILSDGTESSQYSANGDYEITVLAAAGTNLQFRADADFVGSIDDVQCFHAEVANVTVRETLAATTAQVFWDEQTFSTVRGHPRAVTFHDKRLCFAGSTDRPDGFWASKTSAYFNFDLGTGLDAEAIDVSVVADRVAEVRHLVSTRNLQVFSNGAELYVPQSQANPLTPTNVSFIQQTPYGANQAVNPVKFDGATLFMQRTGKAVREYVFSDTEQAYTSGVISLRSNHLIGTSVDSAAMLGTDERPEQYAFFVKADGDVAVFHSVRNEELAGWVLWTTDGDFKSITAVENKVFAAVERTINGSTVLWLEEFSWGVTLDAVKEFAADADRVTNGTFDTDASWIKGTGWTIDGSDSNKAECDGSASSDSDLEQAITATSTNIYQVRFTISDYSAGTLTPRVADGAGTPVSADGTYIQYITASSGANLQMRADSDFIGAIDDIIVKEVTKDYTSAHLVSEAVKVVTNDAAQYAGAYTTNGSGIIATDEYLNGADIGLDYSISVETMPIDAPGRQAGGVTGTMKRVARVVLSVISTQSVSLANNKLILTQTNQDFSEAPEEVEGEYEFFTLGWSLQPTITISQGEPLPLSVRGLHVEVKV